MNQILVTEKLYITPEIKKRKKECIKLDSFLSVFFNMHIMLLLHIC